LLRTARLGSGHEVGIANQRFEGIVLGWERPRLVNRLADLQQHHGERRVGPLRGALRPHLLFQRREPVGEIGGDAAKPRQLLLNFLKLGSCARRLRRGLSFGRSKPLLELLQPRPGRRDGGFELIDAARQRALRRFDRIDIDPGRGRTLLHLGKPRVDCVFDLFDAATQSAQCRFGCLRIDAGRNRTLLDRVHPPGESGIVLPSRAGCRAPGEERRDVRSPKRGKANPGDDQNDQPREPQRGAPRCSLPLRRIRRGRRARLGIRGDTAALSRALFAMLFRHCADAPV